MTTQREISQEDVLEAMRLKAVVDGKAQDYSEVQQKALDDVKKAESDKERRVTALENKFRKDVAAENMKFEKVQEASHKSIEAAGKAHQDAIDALKAYEKTIHDETGATISLGGSPAGGRTRL